MKIKNLDEIINQAAKWAINIRRELHQYPELGNEEDVTANLIKKHLDELCVPNDRILSHTVIGHKSNGKYNERVKCLALRADIDALKIQENTQVPFKSKRDGYMHACGHDVHTAILLGTAKVLNQIGDSVNTNIKYIFQQDEEGNGKGKEVVKTGVLNDVDVILGLHVKPELLAGCIGLKYGKMNAASLIVDLTIIGEKSHAAYPHKGKDAINAAAHIASAASGMQGRFINPANPSVLSFGKIDGGSARNVLAEKVRLCGIIRGEDQDICDAIAKHLFKLSESIASAWGCHAIINLMDGCPPLINEDETVLKIKKAIEAYNNLYVKDPPIKIKEYKDISMTADDFAYYTEKKKGAHFYLGSGFSDCYNSDIHTSTFEVNEDCIKVGIEAFTAFILNESSEIM
ncbi:MAG: M20 family metallopeptidase [Eubacteriales bacterium]|nr:M20 family metallopeptidase [Eubacteriales bacterium]MDD4389959.1 M20 family metallopeptidase [Eubacteriales bacterium]